MEHITSALLFPETEPSAYNMAHLLFFFNSLSFYLPTESDVADRNAAELFENLCSGYVPAPLHEDLARFNRLLREMETSRSDDLARLFSAAKAPLTTEKLRDKDEASTGSVLSALQNETNKKTLVRNKERLWQARLILKLAEMLDRRESEVRQGLARVALSEQKIFASLEGLSDVEADDLAELTGLEKLKRTADTKSRFEGLTMGAWALLAPLRIKAWAELFLVDSSPNRPHVLVTTSPDCGSILLDGYENTWRRTPQKLFSLSIPIFYDLDTETSAKNEYFKSRNKLQAAAKVHLEYFASFLKEAADLVQPPPDNQIVQVAEHVEAWGNTVEIEFPASKSERKNLDFYCLPGICADVLFQKLFHLEPVMPAKEKRYTNSILAILGG